MSNIERRIERLEKKLGTKAESRIIVMTNVTPLGGEETPDCVKIAPECWAISVWGGPFTEEEIRKLREEHKAEYEELRGKGKFHD